MAEPNPTNTSGNLLPTATPTFTPTPRSGEDVTTGQTSVNSATPLPLVAQVTPNPTPVITLTPTPTPILTPPTPTSTPVFKYYGGNSGRSGSGSTQSSGLEQSPTFVSEETPQATPTPEPQETLQPTPTPTQETTQETEQETENEEQEEQETEQQPNKIVIINEIAWMGTASSSSDEWIELYNAGDQAIDLAGWTLKTADGTPDITLENTIEPFGFYLLERTNFDVISDICFQDDLGCQVYSGALGNDGEILELRDPDGVLADFINASESSGGWNAFGGINNTTADPPARYSMEIINPRKSGNDPDNWATNDGITKNGLDAGGNPVNGTPKNQNSVFEPDPADPEQTEPTEPEPPSAISDLSAGKFTLTWSAPEDKDTLPEGLAYDIRYATKSFETEDDWQNAVKIPSASLPFVGSPATPASASFAQLSPIYGKTLYFSAKTYNIADPSEISEISNTASVNFKSAVADTWSMWGGDSFHTGYKTDAEIGKNSTISWKFGIAEIGTVGQMAAAEDGDIIFGVSSSNEPDKLYSIGENGFKNWIIETHSVPSSPTVLSDGAIYFGLQGNGVRPFTALNGDGSTRWVFSNSGGVVNVAVANTGEAYFSTNMNPNSRIIALSPDGSLKNEMPGPGLFFFTPIIFEDGSIVTSTFLSGHSFFNLYSPSGDKLWTQSYIEAHNKKPADLSFDKERNMLYSAAGSNILEISPNNTAPVAAFNIAKGGIAATMVSKAPETLFWALILAISAPRPAQWFSQ